MATPPPLFDPNIRNLRRARAGAAQFLLDEAASQISERLEEINRPFPNRRIVSPTGGPWVAAGLGHTVIPDDDVLDVAPDSLDLMIHGLCLHAANDPVGQLIQCRRALKPDGLCLAVLFGGQTLHELRTALAEAETEIRGGISPRVHPMAEIRDLGSLIQRAGFALPVADSFTLTVTYPTPLHLMHDLRAMGETNAMASQARHFMRRDVLTKAFQIYSENFANTDGRIRATFELVFLTGWAPAEIQQKPLRPGSAKARLADALGVPELPTGDKPGH